MADHIPTGSADDPLGKPLGNSLDNPLDNPLGSSLDDLLDGLVAEFSDAQNAGRQPSRAAYLERVPPAARPGFERVLKMIE